MSGGRGIEEGGFDAGTQDRAAGEVHRVGLETEYDGSTEWRIFIQKRSHLHDNV